MGRLSLIIQVDPKFHHLCPYKRKIEGAFTNTQRKRQCELGGRDQSDMATSQGMPGATRSWKRQKMHYPLVSGGSMALPTL